MKPIEFHLNEFKAMARWLDSKLPAWLAFVLKGYLKGLEERWIDAKVQSSVEAAIAPHRPSEPQVAKPEFIESESDVQGLPILELKATWQTSQSSDQRTQTPSITTSPPKTDTPKTTDSHQ